MTTLLKLLVSVFCVALVIALTVPAAMGQKEETKKVEATITQMEKENAKARVAGGSSWWSKNLAENYTGGTSWGAWETKQELLKDSADSKNNNSSKFDVSDISVRVYGNNTAIATFRTSYDSVIKGEHRSRTILTTDTWVNENGAWKLAASHSSQADQKIGDN